MKDSSLPHRSSLNPGAASRAILLEGSLDSAMLPLAFAQQISLKEEQYRSRLRTGGVITATDAGTVVFGYAVWVLTTIPCAVHGLHFPSIDGGTEGMSPEDRRNYEQEKAEEAAREKAEKKSCEERSPGKPIMMLGGAALIAGVATLISSQALSEELRKLKKQAASSGVAVSPCIHTATGSPGLLAQVRF